MHPTKIESVNDLVGEEPKEDYVQIDLTWVETYLEIRPTKNKMIRAKFVVPLGYNKKILHRMVRISWRVTTSNKKLVIA
jgi:hypothetical protein